MSEERAAERPAAGEWAGAVDARLTARLLRRATHPGVISRAPAAVTYARTQRMASRLPLLETLAARSAVASGTASGVPVVSALPLALPAASAVSEDARPSALSADAPPSAAASVVSRDAPSAASPSPLVQRSAAPTAPKPGDRTSTPPMRGGASPSTDAASPTSHAAHAVSEDAGPVAPAASAELPVVMPTVRGVQAASPSAGMIHRSPAPSADAPSASALPVTPSSVKPTVSGDAPLPIVVRADASAGDVQRIPATLAQPTTAANAAPTAATDVQTGDQVRTSDVAHTRDAARTGDVARTGGVAATTRSADGPQMPLMRQRRRNVVEDSASAPMIHRALAAASDARPAAVSGADGAAGTHLASAFASPGTTPSIQRATVEPGRDAAESASTDSPLPVVTAVASSSARDGGFGSAGSGGEMIHRAPVVAVARAAADRPRSAARESAAGAASPVVSAVPTVQRRADGSSGGAFGGPRLVVAEARRAAASGGPAAPMVQRMPAVRAEAPAGGRAAATLVHAPPRAWAGESGAGGFPSPVQRMSGGAALAVQRQASPEPAPAPAAEMPTRTAEAASAPDVSRIADQVYDILAARLASERRQRGL